MVQELADPLVGDLLLILRRVVERRLAEVERILRDPQGVLGAPAAPTCYASKMSHALPSLSEWGNFYVITGSAAAALTGLQFVVIALGAETIAEAGEHAIRAFGTPNVVHFCGVLLVAAILCVPGHTVASLAWCIAGTGVAGLVLSTRVVVLARRQQHYRPVLEDWIGHVVMPLVAYATLTVAAVLLLRSPRVALDLVAAGSVLLLLTGIRNAWDSAVWIAAGRH
jgi:hypothetical protein